LIEPEVGNHRFFKVHRTQELIHKGEDKALAVLKSDAVLSKGERKRVEIEEVTPHPVPSLSLTVDGQRREEVCHAVSKV